MRILFSVAFSPSNARATLPLVLALTEAGHEVLVVGPGSVLRGLEGEPVRTAAALPEMGDQLLDLMQGEPLDLPEAFDPFAAEMFIEFACGPHITEIYDTLLPVAADFEPHLVLRSGTEFTGLLVAEKLGVPHLSIPSGSGQYVDPANVLVSLNERRTELGLPISGDSDSVHRYGRLDAIPPSYSLAKHPMPPAFSYQQPGTVTSGESIPAWVAELRSDRPLVIASASTVGCVVATDAVLRLFNLAEFPPELLAYSPTRQLSAIVAGLSEVDCEAIVLTGDLPVDSTLAAANVHLVDYLPQALLLDTADLLVTHGGYNSIREAIRAGVPMAVLPMLNDQAHNADRVQDLGIGVRIPEFDPDQVARACRRVLRSQDIAAEIRRAQRHMLALPPTRAVTTYLEGVVRKARSRTRSGRRSLSCH